jgi:hypothetical protein
VRFEDFVDKPAHTLAKTLAGFGATTAPKPISESTKNHGKPLSELQHFYANEHWRNRLTAPTVRAINELLDWPLVDQFCYERLDAHDFPEKLGTAKQEAFSQEMLNLNRKPEIQLSRTACST